MMQKCAFSINPGFMMQSWDNRVPVTQKICLGTAGTTMRQRRCLLTDRTTLLNDQLLPMQIMTRAEQV